MEYAWSWRDHHSWERLSALRASYDLTHVTQRGDDLRERSLDVFHRTLHVFDIAVDMLQVISCTNHLLLDIFNTRDELCKANSGVDLSGNLYSNFKYGTICERPLLTLNFRREASREDEQS